MKQENNIIIEKVKNNHNLEPIKVKFLKKEFIQNIINNKFIETEKKVKEEEEPKRINNKLILKPIEIKDPRKNQNWNGNNNNIIKLITNNDIVNLNTSVLLESSKFSRTSDFNNFKLLENIENYNNIEITRLEENLNLKPGEIIKNIRKMRKMKKDNNNHSINNDLISNTEIADEIGTINDLNNNTNNNNIYKIKLEEMITLNLINSTKTCGFIKKMLHAASLKIYAIRVYIN